jgi:hypothetical protein
MSCRRGRPQNFVTCLSACEGLTVSNGSATAAGLKRLDDSFQIDLDIGGGISALLGLAGRSSLQGAIESSPAADGSRPTATGRPLRKQTLKRLT